MTARVPSSISTRNSGWANSFLTVAWATAEARGAMACCSSRVIPINITLIAVITKVAASGTGALVRVLHLWLHRSKNKSKVRRVTGISPWQLPVTTLSWFPVNVNTESSVFMLKRFIFQINVRIGDYFCNSQQSVAFLGDFES